MILQEDKFIQEQRKIFVVKDTEKLERKNFMDKFSVKYTNDFETFEMYYYGDDVIKFNFNKPPQFWREYYYNNTRKKLPTETRAEIDRLPFEDALKVIWRITKELMINNYHFAVFYAEGGRSPHIIIYDFEELRDLKPHQRELAQKEFWRSMAPFDFHLLDKGMWQDDHFVPLEFAPHWKHKTPFQLCFEYIPEVKKCNQ